MNSRVTIVNNTVAKKVGLTNSHHKRKKRKTHEMMNVSRTHCGGHCTIHMPIRQITVLCVVHLTLYNVVCQSHLNKTEKKFLFLRHTGS